jgi:hypothetical protein
MCDWRNDKSAVVFKTNEPRSNRWSMLGVNNNPFSPFNRSSLVESRHGLQWLATKWTRFSTPVPRHLDSIFPTSLFEQALPPSRTDDG